MPTIVKHTSERSEKKFKSKPNISKNELSKWVWVALHMKNIHFMKLCVDWYGKIKKALHNCPYYSVSCMIKRIVSIVSTLLVCMNSLKQLLMIVYMTFGHITSYQTQNSTPCQMFVGIFCFAPKRPPAANNLYVFVS